MLFLIPEDYRRLRISNNRIYSGNSDITAIYSDCITQSFIGTEYNTLCLNNGKLEYRFMNELNLDSNCIIIVADIPELNVNICRMYSSSVTSIEIPYIELDWVKQSVDMESLIKDVPKHLDILNYDDKLRLEYFCEEDKLYSELNRMIGLYNTLYMELHEYGDEPDIIDLIELFDNIDKLLDSSKGEYSAELLDRLQFLVSDTFLDDDIYIEDLFPAIFAEYHWNNYFKSKDYNVISKIKEGDMQWVEK